MNNPIHPHWGIDKIVAELRDIRNNSLSQRKREHNPPRLPSRKSLAEVVDALSSVMFPNRLGLPGLTREGVDYVVGTRLDHALHQLADQIRFELRFVAEETGKPLEYSDSEAISMVQKFALNLPKIRNLLDLDIAAAYQGDPAARSVDEILVCYPGIWAMLHHRLAHELYLLGAPLVARIIAEIAHSSTGIDIHPGAQISGSFFIDHGTGVVIGETAIIGERVRLYQAVTLGAKRFPTDENGVLIKGNLRHPIVEDDVVIYAGATILGRITIGRGSTIGGNVWLTHSVPPHSNISQATFRNESFLDGGGI